MNDLVINIIPYIGMNELECLDQIKKNSEIIKKFPNLKGIGGKGYLFYAIKFNYLKCVKCLVEDFGCDVNIKDDNGNLCINSYPYNNDEKTRLKIIKYLLSKGLNINSKNNENESIFFFSDIYLYQNIYDYCFVNKIINLELKNNEGDTILNHFYNNTNILEYLLKKGVNINTQNNNGDTILHKIVRNNKYFLDYSFYFGIKKCVEYGFNFNLENNKNKLFFEDDIFLLNFDIEYGEIILKKVKKELNEKNLKRLENVIYNIKFKKRQGEKKKKENSFLGKIKKSLDHIKDYLNL